MLRAVDLNADLGEGSPNDTELVPLISSASVACGGHTGDRGSMRRMVIRAIEHSIRIGAHPSYPDREGFGRSHIDMSEADLERSLTEQVQSLIEVVVALGAEVAYIKPHGALYNEAAANRSPAAGAVIRVAKHFGLPLMALAGSPITKTSAPGFISEGFIDRGYSQDGTLLPRDHPGALISGPAQAAAQALALAPTVDSLCVHSDSPNAVAIAFAARSALVDNGYTIGA